MFLLRFWLSLGVELESIGCNFEARSLLSSPLACKYIIKEFGEKRYLNLYYLFIFWPVFAMFQPKNVQENKTEKIFLKTILSPEKNWQKTSKFLAKNEQKF